MLPICLGLLHPYCPFFGLHGCWELPATTIRHHTEAVTPCPGCHTGTGNHPVLCTCLQLQLCLISTPLQGNRENFSGDLGKAFHALKSFASSYFQTNYRGCYAAEVCLILTSQPCMQKFLKINYFFLRILCLRRGAWHLISPGFQVKQESQKWPCKIPPFQKRKCDVKY